jgi:hypothetical protein
MKKFKDYLPPLKSISLVGSYRAFVLGFFDF